MTLKERIKELANAEGISLPALEAELGFGNGTIVKWDKSTPNAEKLNTVAKYFGVTMDYLLNGETEKGLTNKDKRDISKTVNELMEKLDSNDGAPLFYDGEEMDEQTKLLFRNQLNSLVTTVKEINKVKYNPNKNKGEK